MLETVERKFAQRSKRDSIWILLQSRRPLQAAGVGAMLDERKSPVRAQWAVEELFSKLLYEIHFQ